MNNITEIRCPKCGSDSYDCYNTENNGSGVHWDYCYCEDCDAQFDVKDIATEIKLD